MGSGAIAVYTIKDLSWEQELFAKTVTTASAEALAEAEQLTFIVRVSG
jgi:hypothetical protein